VLEVEIDSQKSFSKRRTGVKGTGLATLSTKKVGPSGLPLKLAVLRKVTEQILAAVKGEIVYWFTKHRILIGIFLANANPSSQNLFLVEISSPTRSNEPRLWTTFTSSFSKL
jgi:hypothetical protein